MKIIQNHPQLTVLGITEVNRIYWQLNTPQLYEEAVQRHEAYVAHLGSLVVRTGNHSSLAYSDRYIVAEPTTQGSISWSAINRAFDAERFEQLLGRMAAYFKGLDLFIQDAYVRISKSEQMPIRVITETAWHNLFVRINYLHPDQDKLDNFRPEFTVIHAPNFRAIPERDGTNSDVFVILDFSRKLILIGGTSFAGEIQKAIFSVLNYLLPRRNTLTLEAAANIGDKGDTALFLGVDGSGKTTLATDENRILLSDAEVAWDAEGIVSIGSGCYARGLGLKMEDAPEIWQTTRRFGTILENAVIDPQSRQLDLEDKSFTDNVRISYPISHIFRASRDGLAKHPRHIFLLAKDGYGVLPAVSKLSYEQAQFYFLSGYTTELQTNYQGETSAQPKFTACYGAPFMPLHPGHYAQMFAERIKKHDVDVWLLNTGWIGGDYSTGKRIPLAISRSLVQAVLNGKLASAQFKQEPYFGLQIPSYFPNIPAEILNPGEDWTDAVAYARSAQKLIASFDEHMAQYQNEINPGILLAQPKFG
jgi:phosphoenolpyruvate carboxykinase (ATP)